ncbi:hypothetical protein [Aureispira anguillae]|uniref:Uncharacterized protein n=1 Tax=Aureispira anguillae TaxID=2864201 RepID=A0A915VK62_9BACT|nr:hypothetical protein [Aureispira anguillae]BDS09523.1 hypothetical protein AsAng_0002240 [Aureispira anguillae]
MKIELAHDILAKKIYDMASAEDKMLIKIQNFILTRYAHYTEVGALLDQNSLDYIEPYIKKITLEQQELSFIKKSRQLSLRKRRTIKAVALGTCLVLLIFGIQASKTFYELQLTLEKKQEIRKELHKIQEERSLAELRAQTLLEKKEEVDQDDLTDVAVIKQLIMQYDTLGQQQQAATQQRDLAQSATLSDLAEEAKEQHDDQYAFQLAAKAWELNKNNNQALEILEELSQEKEEESFIELPTEEQEVVIEKAQKKGGRLKDKDLNVIFSKENTVVQSRSAGVKKAVKSTTASPNQQEQVATPILHRVIQEKLPPKRPSVTAPLNCTLAQKNINKWFEIKETQNFKVSIKYGINEQLHFLFAPTHSEAIIPNLTQLNIHTAKQFKSIDLSKKIAPGGKIIYTTKLEPVDKIFLKKGRIVALSFVQAPQKSPSTPPKKFMLSPVLQQKFLTMSKCLL